VLRHEQVAQMPQQAPRPEEQLLGQAQVPRQEEAILLPTLEEPQEAPRWEELELPA
jgi:hypothetical protein